MNVIVIVRVIVKIGVVGVILQYESKSTDKIGFGAVS